MGVFPKREVRVPQMRWGEEKRRSPEWGKPPPKKKRGKNPENVATLIKMWAPPNFPPKKGKENPKKGKRIEKSVKGRNPLQKG